MTKAITTKRKKKGFTLIELIIVLAIMAILAAIAIPGFNAIRQNSRIKADKQSCEVIKKAVQTLVVDGTLTHTGTVTLTTASDLALVSGTIDSTDITALRGVLADVKAPTDTTVTGNKFTVQITSTAVEVKTESDGVRTSSATF
ncbi:type II secretion system protein [Clostridium sp. 'White wine YQ']|uniref:type II secretion system protein n=1 Tax=Clostridium sp. 'White wine YQ' TaxID=3027474 RepID=UPI0023656AF3|nr:prepilin-type N-terminal cleavage/methylation domain-containing protein [Clostridium sp. 'White wine YQ']MDD7795767.1 prepilin-type N-terminal cleavage/methylation domain-containing protein [Clostridium sp. 'White wine YQ']